MKKLETLALAIAWVALGTVIWLTAPQRLHSQPPPQPDPITITFPNGDVVLCVPDRINWVAGHGTQDFQINCVNDFVVFRDSYEG